MKLFKSIFFLTALILLWGCSDEPAAFERTAAEANQISNMRARGMIVEDYYAEGAELAPPLTTESLTLEHEIPSEGGCFDIPFVNHGGVISVYYYAFKDNEDGTRTTSEDLSWRVEPKYNPVMTSIHGIWVFKPFLLEMDDLQVSCMEPTSMKLTISPNPGPWTRYIIFVLGKLYFDPALWNPTTGRSEKRAENYLYLTQLPAD